MTGGAGTTSNGTGNMSINAGGISPDAGMQASQTDDETNAMARYVLADNFSSPDGGGFDIKAMLGGQSSLDALSGSHGNGHVHTLSSGPMNMEGVETSSGTPFGLGSSVGMGGQGSTASNVQGFGGGNGNGGLGVASMLADKTSPSTGSGEGDEAEDEDFPRGRRTTRFPAGVGKQEDEPPML